VGEGRPLIDMHTKEATARSASKEAGGETTRDQMHRSGDVTPGGTSLTVPDGYPPDRPGSDTAGTEQSPGGPA
jgi:hypothetical protein